MLAHRYVACKAGQRLELLPHEAVANHDDALLCRALRKLPAIPWAQVALKGFEHLAHAVQLSAVQFTLTDSAGSAACRTSFLSCLQTYNKPLCTMEAALLQC